MTEFYKQQFANNYHQPGIYTSQPRSTGHDTACVEASRPAMKSYMHAAQGTRTNVSSISLPAILKPDYPIPSTETVLSHELVSSSAAHTGSNLGKRSRDESETSAAFSQGTRKRAKNVMPVDRRPTPGRIINPRAVNEHGAVPIPSRGKPEDWPAARDPHYSNRSYQHRDEHGRMVDNDDAPQGPPMKLGRSNNPARQQWENDQCLNDPNKTFHCLHLCYRRGPNGPPTYDSAGFQLDYQKVVKWFCPMPEKRASRRMGWIRMLQASEKKEQETQTIISLFFRESERPERRVESTDIVMDAIRDRVSKDLGIMLHEVGLPQIRDWDRMRFPKARGCDYAHFSPEYKKRLSDYRSGCVYRVGLYRGM